MSFPRCVLTSANSKYLSDSITNMLKCPAFTDLQNLDHTHFLAEDQASVLMRMMLGTGAWLDSPLEDLWVSRSTYRPARVEVATRAQRASTYIAFAKGKKGFSANVGIRRVIMRLIRDFSSFLADSEITPVQ